MPTFRSAGLQYTSTRSTTCSCSSVVITPPSHSMKRVSTSEMPKNSSAMDKPEARRSLGSG